MNILRNLLVLGLAIFVLNTSVAKEDYFIVLNKTSVGMNVHGEITSFSFPWTKSNDRLTGGIYLEPGVCMRISSKDMKNILMPASMTLPGAELYRISSNDICSLGNCKAEDSEIVQDGSLEGSIYFRIQPLSSPVRSFCKLFSPFS